MRRVILQPAGGTGARAHFRDTVESPVEFDRIADVLTADDRDALRALYPAGRAAFWGVTPGVAGGTARKVTAMAVGDFAMFAGQRRIFAGGAVSYLFRNEAACRETKRPPTRCYPDLQLASPPRTGIRLVLSNNLRSGYWWAASRRLLAPPRVRWCVFTRFSRLRQRECRMTHGEVRLSPTN
jgi:hypothetical protein